MSGQRSEPEEFPADSKPDSEPVPRVESSGSSHRSLSSSFAFLSTGLGSVLRGEIGVGPAARELLRRAQVAAGRRRERGMLDQLGSEDAELCPDFETLSAAELLKHFSERRSPAFLPGFEENTSTAKAQQQLFPDETRRLLSEAQAIIEHRWHLLGFGEMDFGSRVNWNLDPLSGRLWPLDYHASIPLWHNDSSDIRVLWELNRLGHLITLGRAYALTRNEKFAEEYFDQVEEWQAQNPVGRGANWACAMEVALRAMNLLAAHSLFRKSPGLTEERLLNFLGMLEQHGKHIQRNLEFSHIATSNHYLSDVVGLLWLGVMLPELSAAQEWRDWAMAEMLREMDKQILPDGADYEASTGYHRFVLELFLYSFILCDNNDIAIDEKYWQKLRAMFGYLHALLRPDGRAPLIGDTDGGQVLPVVRRTADDHAYLLSLGAIIFEQSSFKSPRVGPSEELLWTLGEEKVRDYEKLAVAAESPGSQSFPDAGTFLLRKDDLYLLFNLSGSGVNGRGSHGHNDALSIEVSACGCAFVVDSGVYVYTANLRERHLFRSTAYHSTIQVDGVEQNNMQESVPFVVGDEAHPQLLNWQTTAERDYVSAEHSGYARLSQSVVHRRNIMFDKNRRWWLIEDQLSGEGEHTMATRFHFAAEREVETWGDGMVVAWDKMNSPGGAKLFICGAGSETQPRLEEQFTSNHYGAKLASVSAVWSTKVKLPWMVRWAIVPVCAGEDENERVAEAADAISNLKFEI